VHLFSVFSLRNRALIALITVVIGIFGGIALTSFKQELIPSLSLPSVFIVTSYPGASPDVVNTDVSTPIESALQGIENLDSTTATSNTSASTVTASFTYGTDIATSEQKVQLALDRIKTILPSNVTPQVITFSLSDFPVIQLAVTSDMDANTLAAKLSSLTVTNLKQLDGVSDVSLLGAASQRVTITPDADKLAAEGLSIQSIKTALSANRAVRVAHHDHGRDRRSPTARRSHPHRSHHCGRRDRGCRERPDERLFERQRQAGRHPQHHEVGGRQHGVGVAPRAG